MSKQDTKESVANPAKDAVHFRYQLDEQQGMAWLTVVHPF
jgi:hypothetical protein